MTSKDLFCVVVRLTGLYMLVHAFTALGLVVLDPQVAGNPMHQGFSGNEFVLAVIGPAALGFYFLRFAPAIAAFAWGNEASKGE